MRSIQPKKDEESLFDSMAKELQKGMWSLIKRFWPLVLAALVIKIGVIVFLLVVIKVLFFSGS
ncbi:MAG: hypothetical protein SFT92_02050 [Rickettsiales bacterium]|nr:hypothetical protein [Rickettsiales bacterium]